MRSNAFERAAEGVERGYSKRLTWVLLLASAGFFWLFNFSALPLSNPELIKTSGGEGLLDLMPYYTAQEAFAILGRYGARGRELYLRFLAADFAFVPVYTLGLAFLMTRAVRAACPKGNSWLWLNLLPFGIGIFDDVEDFCILAMLGLYPEFSAPIGTLAGIATQCKNSLTLLTVLTLFLIGRFLLGCRLALNPKLRGDGSSASIASQGNRMAMMQAVMITKWGGPEVLQAVELPLPEPGPGAVRVKISATGVGATDIGMRRGSSSYAPPVPFVPGYESIGMVDAVGANVTTLKEGDRVCALLVHGGYATHVVRGAEHWVKVPDGLEDVEAVALILNYVTAYQMIHRVARLQPGQWALVNAANGGVGQALLDLLRAHGVSAIGAAARARHDIVRSYGAIPIEGRSAPLDAAVHAVRPKGVDAAFDGVGGAQTGQCVSSTRQGGMTVWYGFGGAKGFPAMARSALSLLVGAPLLGRAGAFYGITKLYRKTPRPFLEDLPKLFDLLEQRRISPRIARTYPLLDARKANERLEAGGIEGKLVLVAFEDQASAVGRESAISD